MPQTGKSAPEDVIKETNQGQRGPINKSNTTSGEGFDELLNSASDTHIALVDTQAYPCQTQAGEVPTVLVTSNEETETAIETVTSEAASENTAVETVTSEEASENTAPTAEEEEINATSPNICFQGVKEWRQAETGRLKDGCHKMSLNLSRPGKLKPVWQDEIQEELSYARMWQ